MAIIFDAKVRIEQFGSAPSLHTGLLSPRGYNTLIAVADTQAPGGS
jgi:hypothetical protein